MLPVIAANVLESESLLATACSILAGSIQTFTVNEKTIESRVSRNPVLVTALNPIIGYELGAKLAKQVNYRF